MKVLILAFLTVTLLSGPVSMKFHSVAETYQRNVADQLDPSFPKLA